MRSCQPGPSAWKYSSTSRSIRSDTGSLALGSTGLLGSGPGGGLLVAALKAASAAARGSLGRRGLLPVMSAPIWCEWRWHSNIGGALPASSRSGSLHQQLGDRRLVPGHAMAGAVRDDRVAAL